MAEPDARQNDPFDTAAELEEEARMLQQRATVAREESFDEWADWRGKKASENDAELRAAAAARAEADLAREQAASARTLATEALDDMNRRSALIDTAEREGRWDDAAAERADLAYSQSHAQAMVQRAEAASAAAAEADARAAQHQQGYEAVQQQGSDRWREMEATQAQLDEMDGASLVMGTAAAQMAEAERLDAAAEDLDARGVVGAGRVRAAAAQARADAVDTVRQAQALDPTHSLGTAANQGVDPDLIEMDPPDDGGIDPDLIEMDPPDDGGIDPDLIEMDPPDTSSLEAPYGDGEYEVAEYESDGPADGGFDA